MNRRVIAAGLVAAILILGVVALVSAQSAHAQLNPWQQPLVLVSPSKVKQGDKMLVSISGFEPNRQVQLGFTSAGDFPAVGTDANGHASVVLTVPNLFNGQYELYASDAGLAQSDTAMVEISSLASEDNPLIIFSAWQLAKYTNIDSTTRTTESVTIKNVGRVTTTAELVYLVYKPDGSYAGIRGSFLVSLAPGETHTQTRTVQSITSSTVWFAGSSITPGADWMDIMQEQVQAGLPPDGVTHYPQVTSLIQPVGEVVIFPDAPVPGFTCPDGNHFDPETGECVSDSGSGGNGTGSGSIFSAIYGIFAGIFGPIFGANWLLVLLLIITVIVLAVLAARRKRKLKPRRR